MCKQLTSSFTSFRITASSDTRTTSISAPTATNGLDTPCESGTSRCSGYDINVGNTEGIINLPNNTDVLIEVLDYSTTPASPAATYVLNSGPPPSTTNAADTYQSCPFDECSGPFKITDEPGCWEHRDPATGNLDGLMTAPLLAVSRNGNDFAFSWIYIRTITNGAIVNGTLYYKIEYDNDANFSAPSRVVFPLATPGEVFMSTSWKVAPPTVTMTVSPTVFFRVLFSTDNQHFFYGVKACRGACSTLGRDVMCDRAGEAEPSP